MTRRLRVDGGSCVLLPDATYAPHLTNLVHGAGRRVLVSMFIVDPYGASPAVLGLLDALEAAAWRGADVRVLIGGSRRTFDIASAAASGRAVLQERQVPCRWLTGTPVRGSHAKVVVVDDVAVVGSHNWSTSAFGEQTQDSVRIDSAAVAGAMAAAFEGQWRRAGEAL